MKTRPIIFSAPMVRAILEGRKTMTRRLVKPHQLAFVQRMAEGGALAGFLVESLRVGAYLWINAYDVVAGDSIPWTAPEWVNLGPLGRTVQWERLIGGAK